MNKAKESTRVIFSVGLILSVFSNNPLIAAGANVAEVPVLVNYVDYNDVNSVPQGTKDRVKDAIKKANEILGKSGISLAHTDSNAIKTPSGDGDADLNDRNSMRASGPNELSSIYGDCNGLKINIVKDIVESVPGEITRGVSVVGSKVIIIDISQMEVNGVPDINGFGRTIAHETTHDIGEMNDTNGPNDVNKLTYRYKGGGTDMNASDANAFREKARERGRTVAVCYITPGGPAGIVTQQTGYIADARGVIHDSLDDASSPSPEFNPTDAQFKYADIRFVKLFCGEPGQLASTTRVSLYLDGPFPEYDFTGQYYIWIAQGPGTTSNARIEFIVSRIGPDVFGTAYYRNLYSGLFYALGPAIVRNNAEMVENPDIRIPVSATVAFENVPTELISLDLAGGEPTHIYATADVMDSFLGEHIYDQTNMFEFGLSLRENDPVIYLINPGQGGGGLTYGVAGSGFSGIPEVEIQIDDEPVGNAAVMPGGTFRFFTHDHAFEFASGQHKIVVNPTPGQVPPGHGIWAVLRINVAGSELKGDLDENGIVDFYDFAVFASDWLKTSEMP